MGMSMGKSVWGKVYGNESREWYMYMFLNEIKERSKQGQTNKQGKATQHTQGSHFS